MVGIAALNPPYYYYHSNSAVGRVEPRTCSGGYPPSSFSEVIRLPFLRRNAGRSSNVFLPLMPCRMLPIIRSGDKPVLDRIEMYIVHMPVKIRFIADEMLPISALPDFTLSFSPRAFVNVGQATREP